MGKLVTMCTVAYNAVNAVALMYESYLLHHEPPVLFAWDNASTDGAKEYLESKADYIVRSPDNIGHGAGLDHLCGLVETPYTLVCDTDLEFLRPAVPAMVAQQAFVVCRTRSPCRFATYGMDMERRQTDDCCVALYQTRKLQKLLRSFSFTDYANRNTREVFDTGQLLFRVAKWSGQRCVEAAWLEQYVRHYIHITCTMFGSSRHAFDEKSRLYNDFIPGRLAAVRREAAAARATLLL